MAKQEKPDPRPTWYLTALRIIQCHRRAVSGSLTWHAGCKGPLDGRPPAPGSLAGEVAWEAWHTRST